MTHTDLMTKRVHKLWLNNITFNLTRTASYISDTDQPFTGPWPIDQCSSSFCEMYKKA